RGLDAREKRREEGIVPCAPAGDLDAGGAYRGGERIRRLRTVDVDVCPAPHRLAHGHPQPRRPHVDRALANARVIAAYRVYELLGIRDDRVEAFVRTVPLDHRELARVVRSALVPTEAPADLDDPLETGREQPFHLIFGRRDEPPLTSRDRVE